MTTAKQIQKLTQRYEPQYNAILAAVKLIQRDGSEELAELAVLVDNAAYHLLKRLHDLHDALAAPSRGQEEGEG